MAGIKRGYAGTIRMMWWMAGLVAAIYVSMLFVGRDHGQVREGLVGVTLPADDGVAAVVEVAEAPAIGSLPKPEEPAAPSPAPATAGLQASASTSVAEAQPGVEAGVTLSPEPLLQPGESLGAVMVVTARGAVVREGPGIQYKLVGRLTKGTEVQEVDRPADLVGWSVIQFTDGNGVKKQGYVASKLIGKKRS